MPAATPSAGCDPITPHPRPGPLTGQVPVGLRALAMRTLILTLVLLLGWLQYRLWVGEGSLAEIHALRSDMAQQTQEIATLRARNQALAAEVANLKAGDEALEERARTDLGMIKQGEVFLQVIEDRPGSGGTGHKP
jgi:cell division protein FtsB